MLWSVDSFIYAAFLCFICFRGGRFSCCLISLAVSITRFEICGYFLAMSSFMILFSFFLRILSFTLWTYCDQATKILTSNFLFFWIKTFLTDLRVGEGASNKKPTLFLATCVFGFFFHLAKHDTIFDLNR